MKKFTEEHSKEMYDILAEIQDTLKDKSRNKGDFELTLYERIWLKYITELMDKINT